MDILREYVFIKDLPIQVLIQAHYGLKMEHNWQQLFLQMKLHQAGSKSCSQPLLQ